MPYLSKVTETSEQAMSIKYNTRVYEMKRAGIEVLVMSLGEASFDIPLFSFDRLPFPDVYHYSHSRGIIELREKLADYFLNKFDLPFDPNSEILITAGSKAAIHMTLMTILDPGDEVIIPEPLWVSYPEQVKLCYGTPVTIPQHQPIHDYEAYITSKTKALIICNPHNPTGYVYKRAELEYFLTLARRHNIWLLCDEAYSDFVNDDSFYSLGKLDREKRHSVIFNSISKNYGISGWRLGYAISNEQLIFNLLKVNQHLITCPATILEYYVAEYFEKIIEITKPQIQQVVAKRNSLAQYAESIGLHALPGSATFYMFVSISPSRLSSEKFCDLLLEKEKISVVPGIGYGKSCDQFIRVSVGTVDEEKAKYCFGRIKALIEETK